MEGYLDIANYRDRMEIRVTDKLSGILCLTATIAPHDLMMALASTGNMPIEFELRSEKVGWKHEHKTEIIPVEFPYRDKKKMAIAVKAVAALEVDGWHGDRSDLENGHRNTADGIKVVFHRWVDPRG